MKTILTGVICAVIGAGAGYVAATTFGSSPSGTVTKAADLTSDTAKINYISAYNGVKLLDGEGVEKDKTAAARGLADALDGKPSSVSQDDAFAAFERFSEVRTKTQEAERQAELEKNINAGTAYLEQKKQEDGVVALPSGLVYKVVELGDGEKPTVEDTIKVHYHGTLIDGTVFDSSVDRGEPVVFELGRVIKGWQEGLALMPAGSKYELYIPASLAYGEGGGGKIKPGSTLVFQVELIEIVKPDTDTTE